MAFHWVPEVLSSFQGCSRRFQDISREVYKEFQGVLEIFQGLSESLRGFPGVFQRVSWAFHAVSEGFRGVSASGIPGSFRRSEERSRDLQGFQVRSMGVPKDFMDVPRVSRVSEACQGCSRNIPGESEGFHGVPGMSQEFVRFSAAVLMAVKWV